MASFTGLGTSTFVGKHETKSNGTMFRIFCWSSWAPPEPAVVAQPVRSGRLEVDLAARRVRSDGRELDMTVREFDLLAFLVTHPGRAFSRAELLEQVWGWSFGDLSIITVYVRRLRDKVEQDPASPTQLQTVWGVGYRWEENSS